MTARHDSYTSVAAHYDLHGWDWYARTSGERLVALLREREVAPGSSILDAGCGTGSLALMLADQGYRVTGVDLSREMVARAKKKDPSATVDWHVGDITALDLGTTFDAIVCVADVLNHLETLDEWEAALRSFHRHLRRGGVVFVDAMTCHGLRQLDQQSMQERAGVTLIVAIIYEPVSRRSTLKVVSFVPSAASPRLYERAQETITEWGQPAADVLARFERAGFADVERVWKETDDPESGHRLTVLATR